VQQLPLDTELGLELFEDRDVVSDGTESRSLSESKYEDPSLEIDVRLEAGETVTRLNCEESWSSVAWWYCESTIWRVWFGFTGVGAMILEGDSARPFGMDEELVRRAWRAAAAFWAALVVSMADGFVFPGMLRMLSLRPVVGSVVWSLAGSCETW
jgi:hypothetical protein